MYQGLAVQTEEEVEECPGVGEVVISMVVMVVIIHDIEAGGLIGMYTAIGLFDLCICVLFV